MTNDFEDRLRASTRRVLDADQAKAAQLESRRLAEVAQVERINSAIQDWNVRMAPLIRSVIEQANEVTRSAQFQLIANASMSHVMQTGGRVGLQSLPCPS